MWGRNILNRIYSPVLDNGFWRIRINEELSNLYGEVDLVVEIQVRKLSCLGHAKRMDNAKVINFVNTRDERRKFGRSRLRWMEDLENDIKAAKIKRWIQKASKKTEWANFLNKAKFLNVASSKIGWIY